MVGFKVPIKPYKICINNSYSVYAPQNKIFHIHTTWGEAQEGKDIFQVITFCFRPLGVCFAYNSILSIFSCLTRNLKIFIKYFCYMYTFSSCTHLDHYLLCCKITFSVINTLYNKIKGIFITNNTYTMQIKYVFLKLLYNN